MPVVDAVDGEDRPAAQCGGLLRHPNQGRRGEELGLPRVEICQVARGRDVVAPFPLPPACDEVACDHRHVALPRQSFAYVLLVARVAEAELGLLRDPLAQAPRCLHDVSLDLGQRHALQAAEVRIIEERLGARVADRVVADLVPGPRDLAPGRQRRQPVVALRIQVERGPQIEFGQDRDGFLQLRSAAVVESERDRAQAVVGPRKVFVSCHKTYQCRMAKSPSASGSLKRHSPSSRLILILPP